MRAAAVLLLAACLGGCAAHADLAREVRLALRSGDIERALVLLERRPDPRSVLWQMERGLLLRAAGRLRESNQAFEAALSRQEDLYTHSVSNEAAALAVNDLVRPYRAASFEVPFLRVYPILNYLELGDLEGAVVEARALSQDLEARRDAEGDARGDWGPGRLLAGLVFESAGEWNDAWVCYRAADSVWAGTTDGPGPALRPWLAASIRRASVGAGLEPGESEPPRSRVVVWVEEGFVPRKEELRLRVPILREERGWGEDNVAAWSDRLGRRAVELRCGSASWGPDEVVESVELALPFYPELRGSASPPPALSVNGAPPIEAFRLEDVGASARAELERTYPATAGRAAARALVKWLAARGAARRSGDWGGRVVGLLGAALERSDTRGWSGLPERIALVVAEAEPGRAQVETRDASGASCTGEFAIGPGGWHFLSCRFY